MDNLTQPCIYMVAVLPKSACNLAMQGSDHLNLARKVGNLACDVQDVIGMRQRAQLQGDSHHEDLHGGRRRRGHAYHPEGPPDSPLQPSSGLGRGVKLAFSPLLLHVVCMCMHCFAFVRVHCICITFSSSGCIHSGSLRDPPLHCILMHL